MYLYLIIDSKYSCILVHSDSHLFSSEDDGKQRKSNQEQKNMMATMAAPITIFLTSFEDATPDFHFPLVYFPDRCVHVSIGNFTQVLFHNIQP
jgi:hypothetical protein